jgi:cell wall-associated NlpC family hydrolase
MVPGTAQALARAADTEAERMTGLPQKPLLALLAACGLLALLVVVPAAFAQKYTDVTRQQWAYTAITAVTDRGTDGHKVLDDYGDVFQPEEPITRELLARSLVLASGNYGEDLKPVAIHDMSEADRYYDVVQVALKHGYMKLDENGDFRPQEPVPAYQAEVAVVRWLEEKYPTADWSLLKTLRPSAWQPNQGWTTDAPVYLPYVVAARALELRYNHPSDEDAHEVLPTEPIDRAEVAYMFERAFEVGSGWQLYSLAAYKNVTFPTLSDRQKEIVSFALKYIGYPYVWAGEFPTKKSPYGAQASGGFDCSGFVFYVMKMHFGYPITVNERGAHDMADRAKPRITRKQLQPGDLIFFGPQGPKSDVATIYHAGLYLGNGWFIHSTGSSDGVTLASLDTSSYYKKYFAWGRRLLTPEELPPAPVTP